MVSSRCCVLNCGGKFITRVRFPHPTSDPHRRFDVWVKLAGDPNLLYMDRMKLYNNKRICLRHFSTKNFIVGTWKLQKDTIPDLNLLVRSSSGHMEFWSEAIKLLQSMVFTDGKKDKKTSSLNIWVRTLRNVQALWLSLKGQGFKNLCPRNLNQDPLENKFGCIRLYGFRNNSPTCINFVGAYKSLILNDMVSAQSYL